MQHISNLIENYFHSPLVGIFAETVFQFREIKFFLLNFSSCADINSVKCFFFLQGFESNKYLDSSFPVSYVLKRSSVKESSNFIKLSLFSLNRHFISITMSVIKYNVISVLLGP